MRLVHKKILSVSLILLCLLFTGRQESWGGEGLVGQVAGLKLGIGQYLLGLKLNQEQWRQCQNHQLPDSYQGTVKFQDGNLAVVVSRADKTILAMYKRKEKASFQSVKHMVAELIDLYGDPTTMAHEKMIYWAFNKNGLISEDAFNEAKKTGQIPALGILATVKLNSTMEIKPLSLPKEKTKEPQGQKDLREGTIYYLITSEPLVRQFMADQAKK